MFFFLQLLRQFKVNVREFTDANDDANKFKNRLANALPCKYRTQTKGGMEFELAISFPPIDNYNRVHLQMSPGIGGSDYINASYIDVSSKIHNLCQIGYFFFSRPMSS